MNPLAIYEDLKEKIIWLEIKPGSTLNLVELATAYNVSRNPVTIALTRLEAEEWVIRTGSHFVASPLTLERVREITEIRLIMEVQACVWAMHRISTEGIKELKEIKRTIAGYDSATKNKEIIAMDVRFHRLLYRETQNSQLENLLNRMLSHYFRFWLSSPNPINLTSFFQDTMELIQAIESKDEIRVKAASTAHIKSSLDEIMGISNVSA
ncbi:MAG: GntR family transcriptional regulator [Desulfobacteraceae bacterium]|nr:GntR family transcriptional regulator [Desulfobacteraceae bacterium]